MTGRRVNSCADHVTVRSYLCLAGTQAPVCDSLVCDDHPVSQPVHSVLELCVTLQIGLHLPRFVQQPAGYLGREGGREG